MLYIIAIIALLIGYLGETLYQNYNDNNENKKINDLIRSKHNVS